MTALVYQLKTDKTTRTQRIESNLSEEDFLLRTWGNFAFDSAKYVIDGEKFVNMSVFNEDGELLKSIDKEPFKIKNGKFAGLIVEEK